MCSSDLANVVIAVYGAEFCLIPQQGAQLFNAKVSILNIEQAAHAFIELFFTDLLLTAVKKKIDKRTWFPAKMVHVKGF